MRSTSINDKPQQTNINKLNINNSVMDYSLKELQGIVTHQQEQIEHNQQLLISREQRLKYLKQQETLRAKRFQQNIQQQEMKHLRLRTLENQINQYKISNSTFENELDILKQIFLNKEDELTKSLHKINDLTKQCEQIRKLKLTANKEQSQNRNELDKLKQELLIRNKLNEQQNRQITYQREIYASKQAELNQLNYRINDIQQSLMKKKICQTITTTPVQTISSSNHFKIALDNVQNTLNNINIAEIEKRMVQLANSFNSINTNETSIIPEINNTNNSSPSSSIVTSKQALASKNEIVATSVMCSSNTSVSFSPLSNESIKIEEQLLPPNLRLNDDILSVHFNNKTSNVKKRHSLCDPCDSLIKYLSPNTEQQQPIQVRDDSFINSSLSKTESTIVAYESLADFQSKITCKKSNEGEEEEEEDKEEQSIMESFISDTESEGSVSDDIESNLSFPVTILPSDTNLKSLLKTSTTPKNTSRRVIFDPLTILLDAAVIGDLELVTKSAKEVKNISQPNDEGLTALNNAVCAANIECIKFLVEFGCDINYADNDGWTSLHCAASCNQISIVEFLIKHGACIYATTIRDNETAADKCEEDEENYTDCSQYLLNVQNDLGVINDGLVYALYDYEPDSLVNDELEFKNGDQLKILRRGDDNECEWWWAKHENTEKEGYIPRNYLGLYPRVQSGTMSSTDT
ncbi:unnamed protein product [Adineta steineri]|uniref:SH3 domain-containing protein n=1 Tax=Adineta steineri TaxID=433720 RepID=A0A814RX57_9BILA|nr:unnamed protein product [Adineta steineri]CAF1434915.1 unnamed protein product [Adineta steineri]